MKKMSKQVIVMIICFFMVASTYAASDVTVSDVVSGTLESIDAKSRAVTFNGKKYKYRIDEKQSVMKVDETEPEVLELYELKVGEMYYFEKVSFKKLDEEPTADDFQDIIFITDVKPMIFE